MDRVDLFQESSTLVADNQPIYANEGHVATSSKVDDSGRSTMQYQRVRSKQKNYSRFQLPQGLCDDARSKAVIEITEWFFPIWRHFWSWRTTFRQLFVKYLSSLGIISRPCSYTNKWAGVAENSEKQTFSNNGPASCPENKTVKFKSDILKF